MSSRFSAQLHSSGSLGCHDSSRHCVTIDSVKFSNLCMALTRNSLHKSILITSQFYRQAKSVCTKYFLFFYFCAIMKHVVAAADTQMCLLVTSEAILALHKQLSSEFNVKVSISPKRCLQCQKTTAVCRLFLAAS